MKTAITILLSTFYPLFSTFHSAYAQQIKQTNVAGAFYPQDKEELSAVIDNFLAAANPKVPEGDIVALIVPHAGYEYSGKTASYAYKLVQNKPYKTVIVIGPSHYHGFSGVSVYPQGAFRTPLGDLEIDSVFARKLLQKNKQVLFDARAFEKEHSLEVQLPFLQKTLPGAKIVPVVMGDCSLETCKGFVDLLKDAIGGRKDILLVASSDMYHGYDYDECEAVDNLTLSYMQNMDAAGLYQGLRGERLQLCGGFPVVSVIMAAKDLGYDKIAVLGQTNSALVTGRMLKGAWTVGYSSSVIYGIGKYKNTFLTTETSQGKVLSPSRRIVGTDEVSCGQEKNILNKEQRKKLLALARQTIETYLKSGKKMEVQEADAVLQKTLGAFVTLHKKGELRGCIGNIIAQQPLYLTVRDMAIESAFSDPRFSPLRSGEFKEVEIEISVLSAPERVDSADKIQLGKHGVIIKKGYKSGVFLPQVALETGWTKEEFLSQLCAQKAGLSPDAWKDKDTEIYIFTAEVFAEESQ